MLGTLNHTAIDPIAGTPGMTDKDNRVYVTTGRSGLIFYMTERMLDNVGLHLSDRVSLTRAGDNKCLVAPARSDVRNYAISRSDGSFDFTVNFPHHSTSFIARENRHSQTACNWRRNPDGSGFIVTLPPDVLLPEHAISDSKLETPQWLVDKVLATVENDLLWAELERRN